MGACAREGAERAQGKGLGLGPKGEKRQKEIMGQKGEILKAVGGRGRTVAFGRGPDVVKNRLISKGSHSPKGNTNPTVGGQKANK